MIYADIDGNQEFDGNFLTGFCSDDSGEDCIIEIVDISEESKSLYIDRIENIDNPVKVFLELVGNSQFLLALLKRLYRKVCNSYFLIHSYISI